MTISISKLCEHNKKMYFLFLLVSLVSCTGPYIEDPSVMHFWIKNESRQNIVAKFTTSNFWHDNSKSLEPITMSVNINAENTQEIDFNSTGFNIQRCPSDLFRKFTILTESGDTLVNLTNMKDSIWDLEESGYIFNWTYTFKEL